MKKNLYSFALSALLVFAHSATHATPSRSNDPDSPTEATRKPEGQRMAVAKKAAATHKTKLHSVSATKHKLRYAMMVLLGLAESKSVTSPHQLRRQLHSHQQQLKMHAKQTSRARRARAHE